MVYHEARLLHRSGRLNRFRSFGTLCYKLEGDRVLWGDFRFANTYSELFKAAYLNYLTKMQWYLEGEEQLMQIPVLNAMSIEH